MTAEEIDPSRFRDVLGHFATGVTIVTALEGGEPVGFTCQAFTALSLEPPLIALAPAKSSTSWPRMTAAGFFCVNMLAADQEQVCRDFAVSGADKFANVHWSPGKTGAPVLDGALRAIECRIELIHDAGDHELVIGRVVGFGPEASGAAGPLLFYRGGFGRFTEAGE